MLKATDKGMKSKEKEQNYESLYHNCRWCRYCVLNNTGFVCTHPEVVRGSDSFAEKFQEKSEKGEVHEILEEFLNDKEWNIFLGNVTTSAMTELKLSGSKAIRLRKIIEEYGEELKRDLATSLDLALVMKFNNEEENDIDIEFYVDPEQHCCDKWE